jgi:sucrose phosphorylase
MDFETRVSKRLEFLYGSDQAPELLDRIKKLINRYGFGISDPLPENSFWSSEDVVLITYGDTISSENGQVNKLKALEKFVNEKLGDAVNTIHILPFFPSSSDKGFSVIDYKQVRGDLGNWDDIERLSEKYNLMADLVINHTSRFSDWFKNYQSNQKPGKDYFIEVEPETDVSAVTRPRNSPLLTTVETSEGLKYVWTTFSDDQIDLDFSNPDVLLEFVDIFLFYVSKGIKMIRLDAIGYLWKEIGTNSIHLDETHQVVKLYRDIVDHIDQDVTLITETNVPFDENVSYFGDGDETHMIYQFSLPPLLLHAILTENGQYLTQWAASLPEPPEGCTYFNFTASHDGIGVRPLEGLVPYEEFDFLVEGIKQRGGFVSYKENPDGTQSPYELNITYFDAFDVPGKNKRDLQIKRYMCSQIIALSLQGIPGIYIHNFIGTPNYLEGVAKSGEKRTINRREWLRDELEKHLKEDSNIGNSVLERYKDVLKIRKQHPAFSPESKQEVLKLGDDFFALSRVSEGDNEEIICISNITSKPKSVSSEKLKPYAVAEKMQNLLKGEDRSIDPELELEPFETVWLKG